MLVTEVDSLGCILPSVTRRGIGPWLWSVPAQRSLKSERKFVTSNVIATRGRSTKDTEKTAELNVHGQLLIGHRNRRGSHLSKPL